MERNDLACLLVHRDPDPLLVGFLLHEAPHLVGFHLQAPDEHIPGGRHRPHVQMIRQGCKAIDDKVHEPPDADANHTANTMQGDFLAE